MRYLRNGARHARYGWTAYAELRFYGPRGVAAMVPLFPVVVAATPVLFLTGMYCDDEH